MGKKASVTKKSSRPTGVAPLWTEPLRAEFGGHFYYLLERIEANSTPRSLRNKGVVTPVIADIRALCCLLDAHPDYPRSSKFGRSDVAAWTEIIEENLETSIGSIPANVREEFLSAVRADLAYLENFLDRKRDPKTDLY